MSGPRFAGSGREVGAVLLALLTGTATAAAAAISGTERAALIALYNATSGAGWLNRTNWRNPSDSDFGAPGTECDGYGVTCWQDGVVTLGLAGNRLTGFLPLELGNLAGLSNLDLSSNRLTGPIPKELAQVRLSYLDLSRNELSGTIPPELGSLGYLQYLKLSSNRLTGPIPKEPGSVVLVDPRGGGARVGPAGDGL